MNLISERIIENVQGKEIITITKIIEHPYDDNTISLPRKINFIPFSRELPSSLHPMTYEIDKLVNINDLKIFDISLDLVLDCKKDILRISEELSYYRGIKIVSIFNSFVRAEKDIEHRPSRTIIYDNNYDPRELYNDIQLLKNRMNFSLKRFTHLNNKYNFMYLAEFR